MLLYAATALGQVKVGDNPTTIHASAVMEIESTTQGLLPPRMTQAQRDAISSPAEGLMVYCTDCNPKIYYYYDGSDWSLFAGTSIQMSADCQASGFSGTITNGNPVSATFSVTFTNDAPTDALINFAPADLSLSGVSGVTVVSVSPAQATISAAGGTQVVTYTLGGTPASTGTLTGDLDVAGLLRCSSTFTVN